MRNIFFVLLCCFLFSCSNFSPEIEAVLREARSNRGELEKVLKHYGKTPADSLKLRAAEFLVVNMPGKYSEYMEGQWNDLATVYLRWTSSSDKQLVLDTYGLSKPVRKDDIKHITAKYLINNIELAFKVWQEMHWGKDIPFDVFCEEILPYRVGNEPLENWREKVMASFANPYKIFMEDTTLTTVEACCKINDLLPRFRMDKDFPDMNYTQLMASTRGTCDGMVMLTAFVMRGLGIPVTIDFTPMWIDLSTGHSWNSVYENTTGKHVSFMGTETNPEKPHQGTTYSKAKAYRKVYKNLQNFTLNEENLPTLLYNANNIVDVTAEYENCFELQLPASNNHTIRDEPVFLTFFHETNWKAVGWGSIDTDTFKFRSIKSCLYLPVYYNNFEYTAANYPFLLDEKGEYRFFIPDSILEPLVLARITQPSYEDEMFSSRMLNGYFEGANLSDFSDAKLLHTIKEIKSDFFHSVDLRHNFSKYRFIRYVSPDNGNCNVSELEFYDESGNKLDGTVIGTTETWGNSDYTRDKVFDGDIHTFFDAEDGYSWVGLEFDKPRRIARIRYFPRTTGNGIYEGNLYELFYWNGNEWVSLEKKTAANHILQCNVPKNAIFILKNVTKNKTVLKPFTIDNGEQQWF